MPATYTAYPTDSEVADFIENSGITLPAAFDVESWIYTAIDEWEEITRYNPFLSPSSNSTFYYDPPGPQFQREMRGGSKVLALDRGFVSIDSIRTGITPDDSTGTLLVVGTDYRLLPYNAAFNVRPYTHIEFVYPQWGVPRSIKIVGEPGFSRTIPAAAYAGILSIAAAYCLRALKEQLASGVIEWKESDVSERKSIELIEKLGDSWMSQGLSAARRYTRMSY